MAGCFTDSSNEHVRHGEVNMITICGISLPQKNLLFYLLFFKKLALLDHKPHKVKFIMAIQHILTGF